MASPTLVRTLTSHRWGLDVDDAPSMPSTLDIANAAIAVAAEPIHSFHSRRNLAPFSAADALAEAHEYVRAFLGDNVVEEESDYIAKLRGRRQELVEAHRRLKLDLPWYLRNAVPRLGGCPPISPVLSHRPPRRRDTMSTPIRCRDDENEPRTLPRHVDRAEIFPQVQQMPTEFTEQRSMYLQTCKEALTRLHSRGPLSHTILTRLAAEGPNNSNFHAVCKLEIERGAFREETRKHTQLVQTEIGLHFKVKEEAMRQARLRALKDSDTDAYMAHLSSSKISTLLHIMETTHRFMARVGAVLDSKSAAPNADVAPTGNAADAVLAKHSSHLGSESEELRKFKAYVASTKDEFKLVHKTHKFVEQQPAGLNATLMPHQLVGLRFLVSLHANNINGILADEMGVGKTIQTLAFLLHLKEIERIQGPHMVLAPLSIIREWREACEQFVPKSLRVCELLELEDPMRDLAGPTPRYDLVLVPIHRVRALSRDVMDRIPWNYIVVDEAHKAVSNLNTLTAQAISAIRFKHRLVLTGTPLNSDLQELWSLLNFINADIFTAQDSFEEVFRRPFQCSNSGASGKRKLTKAEADASKELESDAQLSEEERQLLIMRMHQILRPFMLRRTKKDIDSNLRITFHEVMCPLSSVQQLLLRTLRTHRRLPHISDGETACYKSATTITSSAQGICNTPFMIPFFASMMAREQQRRIDERVEVIKERRRVERASREAQEELALKAKMAEERKAQMKLRAKERTLAKKAASLADSANDKPTDTMPPSTQDITFTTEAPIGSLGKEPPLELEAAIHDDELTNPDAPVAESAEAIAKREAKEALQRAKEEEEAAISAIEDEVKEEIGAIADNIALHSSGKFIVLDMMLRRMLAVKKKCVLFTHWLDCVDLLEEYFLSQGWDNRFVVLTGATSADERKECVQKFRSDPGVFIFLVSMKAGGCGLNLQVANIVILLDKDYTATNEDQAIARVFRIGQRNTVKAIYLTTDDPAEQRITTISDLKNKPRQAIIEGGGYHDEAAVQDESEQLATLQTSLSYGAGAKIDLRDPSTLHFASGGEGDVPECPDPAKFEQLRLSMHAFDHLLVAESDVVAPDDGDGDCVGGTLSEVPEITAANCPALRQLGNLHACFVPLYRTAVPVQPYSPIFGTTRKHLEEQLGEGVPALLVDTLLECARNEDDVSQYGRGKRVREEVDYDMPPEHYLLKHYDMGMDEDAIIDQYREEKAQKEQAKVDKQQKIDAVAAEKKKKEEGVQKAASGKERPKQTSKPTKGKRPHHHQ